MHKPADGILTSVKSRSRIALLCVAVASFIAVIDGAVDPASCQDITIAKTDFQIDALDPGIKLSVREKMPEGNTKFSDDNIVLFLHGATSPSTCDFDLAYKDYSWADDVRSEAEPRCLAHDIVQPTPRLAEYETATGRRAKAGS
jgi:hypothetical protein